MTQRLVLYATLGMLLSAIDQQWNTWGFWCTIALFWALEHITRRELLEEINKEVARIRAEKDAQ